MNLLLFTGAGASVELGVPAMRRMVEELHGYLRNQNLSPNVLGSFESLLSQADYDMETLIEKVDGIESGSRHQRDLGLGFDESLFQAVRTIRSEAEWFVQHACERIREIEAARFWGAALRRLENLKITFATTNYDRSIEIGCSYCEVAIDDGFHTFGDREFAEWKGISAISSIKLLKIHGSTDWYQGEDSAVYKLKHPMPLYGDLAVSGTGSATPKMTSAIVMPTREKRINQPPYPDLVTEFRNAAKEADVAIFVGSSLRDPDLHDLCSQCASRIPTYLVSRSGKFPNVTLPSMAKVIAQSASEFIISTLPQATSSSGLEELDRLSMAKTENRPSVLSWLVTALDDQETSVNVSNSIERLADNQIAIDIVDLRPLLEHTDPTVRNYALALVPSSSDRDQALALAEEIAAKEPESSFATELGALKHLMEKGPRDVRYEAAADRQ